MKATEIIEILKQNNLIHLENDGPTSVFVKYGKKTLTFSLSIDEDFVTVTKGKGLFKRKYKINRKELSI